MAETHRVIDRATFVGVGDVPQMTVQNLGASTAYYGTASVSSASSVGSIVAGASATIGTGFYFVTAAGASTSLAVSPVVASAADLDGLVGLTATAAELNILSGVSPVVVAERTFTETTGAGTYTATVVLPAGSTLIDIIVSQIAVWTATSSASLQIGNSGDPDGYFTAVDLKATDLLATESVQFGSRDGGVGGADATVGTSTHVVDRYSATAETITMTVVTTGAAGNAGRTRVSVVYSLPVAAQVVAASKV